MQKESGREMGYENLDNHAREEETHMANRPPYPGTPRWAKVFGIIAIVVVLLVVAVMVIGGGEHGPGRHTPSGDARSQAQLSSVIEDHAPPEVVLSGQIAL
jgi:hypothetical protein